ncbi:MAG: DEAD/DEAH box helicase [Bacteroidota bacterium]
MQIIDIGEQTAKFSYFCHYMDFRDLKIDDQLLEAMSYLGFEKPTEVQEKIIPLIFENKDVIACAQTGTGKTGAFVLPILNKLIGKNGRHTDTLIIVPTRELAIQIEQQIQGLGYFMSTDSIAIYGGGTGKDWEEQKKALKQGVEIVVATPGKLLTYLNMGYIDFKHLNHLVLDEADRMLDMGFIDDMERIIRKCPKDRQTLLFSATISKDITSLKNKYMKNPIEISAEVHVDPDKLKQVYYPVQDNMKFSLLVNLLRREHSGLVMVFCNTRRNVDFIVKNLGKNDIDSIAIHGGFTQAKREKTLDKFHSKKALILVCTDVAARGLDIPHVSHIYNYDIPADSKEYVHRIGRTARAGKEGKVINILASRDHDNFRRVQADNPKFNIEKEQTPEIDRVYIKRNDNFKGSSRNKRNTHRRKSPRSKRRGPSWNRK